MDVKDYGVSTPMTHNVGNYVTKHPWKTFVNLVTLIELHISGRSRDEILQLPCQLFTLLKLKTLHISSSKNKMQ